MRLVLPHSFELCRPRQRPFPFPRLLSLPTSRPAHLDKFAGDVVEVVEYESDDGRRRFRDRLGEGAIHRVVGAPIGHGDGVRVFPFSARLVLCAAFGQAVRTTSLFNGGRALPLQEAHSKQTFGLLATNAMCAHRLRSGVTHLSFLFCLFVQPRGPTLACVLLEAEMASGYCSAIYFRTFWTPPVYSGSAGGWHSAADRLVTESFFPPAALSGVFKEPTSFQIVSARAGPR